MPQTKQSARKTVGGKAPRKDLGARTAGKKVSGRDKKQRKKRRFKPGTVALREIRRYQNSTNLLLARLPFHRLIREMAFNQTREYYRFQKSALEGLQEIAESFLVTFFEDAQLLAIHRNRITITTKDTKMVTRFYDNHNVFQGIIFNRD